MTQDKAKRSALLKMSGFMVTEVDLLPKLLKNADDMTELGKFFAKYGDEAGGLLKKFGDDLADEMFEVYKKNGDLKETWRLGRNKIDSEVAWLETGKVGEKASGWKHIYQDHFNQFKEKFPELDWMRKS